MANIRGLTQTDFWKTHPEKSFCSFVTSLWTIIGRSHVIWIEGGLLHLDIVLSHTSPVTWQRFWSLKLKVSKKSGDDTASFLENSSKTSLNANFRISGYDTARFLENSSKRRNLNTNWNLLKSGDDTARFLENSSRSFF